MTSILLTKHIQRKFLASVALALVLASAGSPARAVGEPDPTFGEEGKTLISFQSGLSYARAVTVGKTIGLDADGYSYLAGDVLDGIKATLTWSSHEGSSYKIESSTDLVNWKDASGVFNAQGGSTTGTSDALPSASARAFRVKTVSPGAAAP